MDYTNILNGIYSKLGDILTALTSTKTDEYIQIIIAILILLLLYKLTKGV